MRHRRFLLFVAACLSLASCKDENGPAHQAPAQVANARPEAELATVTLTDDAVRRLGITTDTIARRSVSRTRLAPGEVTVPTGRTIMVSAPLAGTLLAPAAGMPAPGTELERGVPVFRMVGMPADLGTAQEAVSVAEANARLARMRATRADELRRSQLISAEEFEAAQAAAQSAEATFAAARARLGLLRNDGPPESLSRDLPPLEIHAPVRGVLQRVVAAPNQRVSAGAPLFEIADLERLWVRVPVFVGDLADIDQSATATVRLTSTSEGVSRLARPVRAPPSANAQAASADLYYEVAGAPDLRPGQRVSVLLPVRGRESRLVVPWSAVVYDVNGGAWVYEQTDPRVFVRRRIEVDWVGSELAVLSRGPAAGTRVVTEGAAELFGTEFGGAK